MPNPTASADGGAMPASGPKIVPSSGATAQKPDLLRIEEALDAARNLIIAASNLASSPDPFPAGLHAVICAAEDRLDDALDTLKAIHGQQAEDRADG